MDERELATYKAALEHREGLFRATTVFEHAALKPLILLNGGGILVLLAFLGTVWGKSPAPNVLGLGIAVGVWALGLLFAAFATGFGYHSQLAFYKMHSQILEIEEGRAENRNVQDNEAGRDKQETRGHCYRIVATALGAASLMAFIVGAFIALVALF